MKGNLDKITLINEDVNDFLCANWLFETDIELIEDEINIDSIEEYKQEHTERCIDIDIRNKMNEILQAVKQIDKRVKKLEEK